MKILFLSSILMIDKDIQVLIGMIIGIALIAFTILTILKLWMDYRLKNKMITNGLPENTINSILQKGENNNNNIKWFAIFAGLGVSFIIINCTLPLGIHSIAILAFSLAGSFLSYFFYLKNSNKSK